MIPTRINLLLPEKRKHLRQMVYMQWGKSILEALLLSVVLSAIVLLSGRYLLQEHFDSLSVNLASLNTDESQHTNKQIHEINTIIKDTNSVQKGYILWTPLLETVANGLPESVTLSSMNINPGKHTLTIQGTARDRESLLLLQEELEKLDIIKNAIVPISQFTQKTDIPFTITAELTV